MTSYDTIITSFLKDLPPTSLYLKPHSIDTGCLFVPIRRVNAKTLQNFNTAFLFYHSLNLIHVTTII